MVMFIFALVNIVSSSWWPYLFCSSANSVTTRLASIADIAFDLNWFDYPPSTGRLIKMVIARSQKPQHFTGLRLFPCTLEIFGDVNLWRFLHKMSTFLVEITHLALLFFTCRYWKHHQSITQFSETFNNHKKRYWLDEEGFSDIEWSETSFWFKGIHTLWFVLLEKIWCSDNGNEMPKLIRITITIRLFYFTHFNRVPSIDFGMRTSASKMPSQQSQNNSFLWICSCWWVLLRNHCEAFISEEFDGFTCGAESHSSLMLFRMEHLGFTNTNRMWFLYYFKLKRSEHVLCI